jgi:hypothetical protein
LKSLSSTTFLGFSKNLRLTFDLSINHQRKKIEGRNEILSEAFKTFERAFKKSDV